MPTSCTAAQIAEQVHGEVFGDATTPLTGLAPADAAKAGDLTFAETEAHFLAAEQSAASAILISGPFTSAAKILIRGGVVCLRTDDANYFAQMTEVFGANPSFMAIETPAELGAVLTDFEREFNARGVSTLRAAYRRER